MGVGWGKGDTQAYKKEEKIGIRRLGVGSTEEEKERGDRKGGNTHTPRP